MNRRTFLASAAGLGACAGLAGCLERDLSTTQPQGPESFDRCPRWNIRIDNLPNAAKNEVETALEEGYYEASPPLYLPNVLDPQSSYLITTDPLTYYRAEIDQDRDPVRLTVDRTVPTKGNHGLTIENNTDDPLDFELLIDFVEPAVSYAEVETPQQVLNESFSLDPGTSVETSAYERVYRRYELTVVADEHTETIRYRETPTNTGSITGIQFHMDGDQLSIRAPEPPVRDDIYCPDYWYDDGL